MTTITELAKTSGIPKAELATKAGELGFKGGTNAELPKNIEKELANIKAVNSSNGNGNGNLSLSADRQTINLENLNLEEELKIASAIGITQAEALLEAMRQSFEQRLEEGQEEMGDYILSLYKEHREALATLQAARPTRKRQSISEKFAELQAEIAKK